MYEVCNVFVKFPCIEVRVYCSFLFIFLSSMHLGVMLGLVLGLGLISTFFSCFLFKDSSAGMYIDANLHVAIPT